MNFKPSFLKVLISFFVGFVFGLEVATRSLFGVGIQFRLLAIVWGILSIFVYVVWSLFQKNNSTTTKATSTY